MITRNIPRKKLTAAGSNRTTQGGFAFAGRGANSRPGEERSLLGKEMILYEEQLTATLREIAAKEKEHKELVNDFELLSEKYIYTKRAAIEACWDYIPKHSPEFKHLPEVSSIPESETSVGEYSLRTCAGQKEFSPRMP